MARLSSEIRLKFAMFEADAIRGMEMSNAMKYIKALEAAGFNRNQAEAQVQMVLDAIEGDLATKGDLALIQERIENRFDQFRSYVDGRFTEVDSRFERLECEMNSRFATADSKLLATENRLLTRLGFLMVSTTSIAVAFLAWLIKV